MNPVRATPKRSFASSGGLLSFGSIQGRPQIDGVWGEAVMSRFSPDPRASFQRPSTLLAAWMNRHMTRSPKSTAGLGRRHFPRANRRSEISPNVQGAFWRGSFTIERGADLLSVIDGDFSNGPAVDEHIVGNASCASAPTRRGPAPVWRRIRSRNPRPQLNIFEPYGRQQRASVYMADHRLYNSSNR